MPDGPVRIAREEGRLATRAAAGDRAAFDALYERYFDRTSRYFAHLPADLARAAIGESLERIFAGLDAATDLPRRAYRIARTARLHVGAPPRPRARESRRLAPHR